LEPLVSILIPAYNAERWLAASLRSAIAQTWKHKEIIVVDDGSRDGTLAIARQFDEQGVKVFNQPNQGAAAARNNALTQSCGDYIQWLDADDLLGPQKIERQMRVLLSAHDERLLPSCAWGRFRFRSSRAEFAPTALWNDLSPAEWLRRKMSLNLHMQTATWLISRKITEASGPWDPTMYVDDDGEYLCRVLRNSSGVRFVEGSAVYYRTLANESLSYIGRSDKKIEAQWRSMKLHIECLLALDDSEQSRRAAVAHIQTWVGLFYPDRLDLVRQAEELAKRLGGSLRKPEMPKKYEWIGRMLGEGAALRAKRVFPRLKAVVQGSWDRAIWRIEKSLGRDSLPADFWRAETNGRTTNR
jgi:glycosyltransferase involved in cell wall biosynthesis